jgi:hypothetical protein
VRPVDLLGLTGRVALRPLPTGREAGRRTRRKRRVSEDEVEYRLFAAAAGFAIAVLVAIVTMLVEQMP